MWAHPRRCRISPVEGEDDGAEERGRHTSQRGLSDMTAVSTLPWKACGMACMLRSWERAMAASRSLRVSEDMGGGGRGGEG